MSPGAKYVLFLLLGLTIGLAVGIGSATAYVAISVIPAYDRTLDESRQTIFALQKRAQGAEQALAVFNDQLVKKQEQIRSLSLQGESIATIETASTGTVIFEPANRQVDVHLSVGMIHGLNLTNLPTVKMGSPGPLAPHWIIPGKVQPTFVGDSQGAVYFFVENNQLIGPLVPQPLPVSNR